MIEKIVNSDKIKTYLKVSAALLAAFILVNPSLTSIPSAARALPDTQIFTISGKGWGHGVGLCQWGAYGQAKAGKTYKDILAYYYKNITLSSAKNSSLRILLMDNQGVIKISANGGFNILDEETGRTVATEAKGATWKIIRGGKYGTFDVISPSGSSAGKYEGPIRFEPIKKDGTTVLKLNNNGRRYRGYLTIKPALYSLTLSRVVNKVMLEDYLKGIAEMPLMWPAEALKAQVIAARSYAQKRIKNSGSFDMYSDDRDQVYNGYDQEVGVGGTNWSSAVSATSGKVGTFNDKIIDAYYFSTCGGSTENSEEVWRNYVPYLRATKCDYCTPSPKYSWGQQFSVSQITKNLASNPDTAIKGKLAGLNITEKSNADRVELLRITGTEGVKDLTGNQFRSAMKLNSTFFWLSDIKLTEVKAAPSPFSPNGDKMNDTTSFSYRVDKQAMVKIQVFNYKGLVKNVSGLTSKEAGTHSVDWDGKDNYGKVLPDGTYKFIVFASNKSGTVEVSGLVTLKGRPAVTGLSASPNPFSPNGDNSQDTTKLGYKLDTWAYVTLNIYSGKGIERTLLNSKLQAVGSHSVVWNGKNSLGKTLANGNYIFKVLATNPSGTGSASKVVTVKN